MLIPAIVLCFAVEFMRTFQIAGINDLHVPGIIHRSGFVIAALSAVAGPLLTRVLFVHSVRRQARVQPREFAEFHRLVLGIAMVTPYLAFLAMLFGFPRFYSAGILLMSFYAAYYYYPSRRRIEFDMRLFRVS